ncbi:MAG: hypothetical protein ACK55Z_15665, partial [bacterium]
PRPDRPSAARSATAKCQIFYNEARPDRSAMQPHSKTSPAPYRPREAGPFCAGPAQIPHEVSRDNAYRLP